MGFTVAEIDDFRDFAVQKLDEGGFSSLAECVHLWEEKREFDESVAGIKESLEDIAAGRTKPVEQAFDDLHQEIVASRKPARR